MTDEDSLSCGIPYVYTTIHVTAPPPTVDQASSHTLKQAILAGLERISLFLHAARGER